MFFSLAARPGSQVRRTLISLSPELTEVTALNKKSVSIRTLSEDSLSGKDSHGILAAAARLWSFVLLAASAGRAGGSKVT